MVYCGKPSEACESCRLKRRKCDLKRPGCTQCIRVRVECPGYRDTASLYFRNETLVVTQKVLERKKQKQKQKGTPTPTAANSPLLVAVAGPSDLGESETAGQATVENTVYPPSGSTALTWGDLSPPLALPVHTEDPATGYFMVSYAPSSTFTWLPRFWADIVKGNEPLGLALQAAALASLSVEFKRPEMMDMARDRYSQALVHTNKALSSPHLAVLDTTLLSVLLLTAFEGIVFRGRKSPTSWTAHVQGSVALLNLRGNAQLETELGRHLFAHASTNIRTSCAQRSIPVPREFSRLHAHAATVLDPTNLSYKFGPLLDRFAALRAGLRGMKATDCVRESLDLNDKLEVVMQGLLVIAPYKIIPCTEPHHVVDPWIYKDITHQYRSQLAARHWNIMRMLRLFLYEWVFCAFDRLRGMAWDEPEPGDPLYEIWDQLPEIAAVQGEEMIDEIMATIPFSLKLSDTPSAQSARFLIWPLAGIGTSELCPASARLFAISTLQRLGTEFDLVQALDAAKMLEDGINMEDWLHLTHLA